MSENNDERRNRPPEHSRGIENLPDEYRDEAERAANREWVTVTTYTAEGNKFRIQIRRE